MVGTRGQRGGKGNRARWRNFRASNIRLSQTRTSTIKEDEGGAVRRRTLKVEKGRKIKSR